MLGGMDIIKYDKSWLKFCKHRWSAKWSACQESDARHIGVMKLLHEMKLFDKFTVITMNVTAKQVNYLIENFLKQVPFINKIIVIIIRHVFFK